jgi:hypothetical protein
MEMGTIKREGLILFSAGGERRKIEKRKQKNKKAYSGLKERETKR